MFHVQTTSENVGYLISRPGKKSQGKSVVDGKPYQKTCQNLYDMKAILVLLSGSVSKQIFTQNHSKERVLGVHAQFHFHANQTSFHIKGLARRLVLKQRHKVTRSRPIGRVKKVSRQERGKTYEIVRCLLTICRKTKIGK